MAVGVTGVSTMPPITSIEQESFSHLLGHLLLLVSLRLTWDSASLGGHITPSQAITGIKARARGLGNSSHRWLPLFRSQSGVDCAQENSRSLENRKEVNDSVRR